MSKTPVPVISNRRLEALAAHIHAVTRGRWIEYKRHLKVVKQTFEPRADGDLHIIQVSDLRQTALTPQLPVERKVDNLVLLDTLPIRYSADRPGPSMAEVLAQVPAHMINDTAAFEILAHQKVDDMERFHVAQTALYTQPS